MGEQKARSNEPAWGHLSGRFVYDGQPPQPVQLEVVQDREAFTEPILDESLLVNADKRGLANVVVYLLPLREGALRVHPSYAETAEAKVTLAMQGGRFEPHVLLLRTSQTLVEENRDPAGHNASIAFSRNPDPQPVIPTGPIRERRYETPERLPVPVDCAIHPWMRGYVLLRDNPYMAKTDADGRFRIENLPAGVHEFQLWHERAGYLRDVPVGAATSDRRGRLTVTIEPGENDLGEVVLDADLFRGP